MTPKGKGYEWLRNLTGVPTAVLWRSLWNVREMQSNQHRFSRPQNDMISYSLWNKTATIFLSTASVPWWKRAYVSSGKMGRYHPDNYKSKTKFIHNIKRSLIHDENRWEQNNRKDCRMGVGSLVKAGLWFGSSTLCEVISQSLCTEVQASMCSWNTRRYRYHQPRKTLDESCTILSHKESREHNVCINIIFCIIFADLSDVLQYIALKFTLFSALRANRAPHRNAVTIEWDCVQINGLTIDLQLDNACTF